MNACYALPHHLSIPSGVSFGFNHEVEGKDDTERVDVVQSPFSSDDCSLYAKPSPLPRYGKNLGIKAQAAVRRILQKTGMKLPRNHLGSTPSPNMDADGSGSPLPNLSHVSMIGLALLSSTLVQTVASVNGDSLVKTEKVNTDANTVLSWKNVQKYQDQLQKQADQAAQSKKPGIFGLILNAFTFIANAISGLFAIVKGVFMLAGSAGAASVVAIASIMSGVCSMATAGCAFVGCVVSIMELSGAISAKQCTTMLGKIAIGEGILSGIGAFCSVVGGCVAAKLAKGLVDVVKKEVGNVAEKAVEEVGSDAGKDAIQAVVTDALKEAADEIAQTTAKGVAEQIAEDAGLKGVMSLFKEASEGALSGLKKVLSKSIAELCHLFSEEGLSNLVSQAIKVAVKDGIKVAAEDTAEEIAEKVAKQIAKKLEKLIAQATSKAFSTALLSGMSAVSLASNQASQSALKIESATLQKDIDQIQVQLDYNNNCIDWFKDTQKSIQETIANLMSTETGAMARASEILNNTAALQARIAQGMA